MGTLAFPPLVVFSRRSGPSKWQARASRVATDRGKRCAHRRADHASPEAAVDAGDRESRIADVRLRLSAGEKSDAGGCGSWPRGEMRRRVRAAAAEKPPLRSRNSGYGVIG